MKTYIKQKPIFLQKIVFATVVLASTSLSAQLYADPVVTINTVKTETVPNLNLVITTSSESLGEVLGTLDCFADQGMFSTQYTFNGNEVLHYSEEVFSCSNASDIFCTNNLKVNGEKVRFETNIPVGEGTFTIDPNSDGFVYNCPY